MTVSTERRHVNLTCKRPGPHMIDGQAICGFNASGTDPEACEALMEEHLRGHVLADLVHGFLEVPREEQLRRAEELVKLLS